MKQHVVTPAVKPLKRY